MEGTRVSISKVAPLVWNWASGLRFRSTSDEKLAVNPALLYPYSSTSRAALSREGQGNGNGNLLRCHFSYPESKFPNIIRETIDDLPQDGIMAGVPSTTTPTRRQAANWHAGLREF